MKQKRKVKSLLPQEGLISGRFLTILLLVLSVILCIGSVSFFARSVRAADNGSQTYTVKVNYLYAVGDWGEITGSKVVTGLEGGHSYEIQSPTIAYYKYNRGKVSGIASGAAHEIVENVYYNAQNDGDGDGLSDKYITIFKYKYENSDYDVIGQLEYYCPIGSGYSYEFNEESGYVIGMSKDINGLTYTGDVILSGICEDTIFFTKDIVYFPDVNGNGKADFSIEDPGVNIVIKYKYQSMTGDVEIQRQYTGYLRGIRYEIPVIYIPYYKPEVSVVSGIIQLDSYITTDTVTVNYSPTHDWNKNNIADEEENLQEINDFVYESIIDNTQEVLYGMQFVDPLDVQKIVNNIYMSGSSLYITPNPVILKNNMVDTGKYSHVLGGEGNEVYSDNITLIAGGNNKVYSGNDNASVLGGKGNEIMPGESDGIPAILVGGEGNTMGTGHDGNVLIGGKENKIEKGSSIFILGGEYNSVIAQNSSSPGLMLSSNVILGGKNVKVVGKDNIFVYSNDGSEFAPLTDNAFYLNMLSGVGINVDSSGIKGLSVGGAVSFGEINVKNPRLRCTEDKLGVKGTYSGCLVGCTQQGKEASASGKWEMLDMGNRCAQVCVQNSEHILCNEAVVEDDRDNTLAECTTGVVDTENAHLCMSGLIDSYRGVLFETSLIDSDDSCPNGENICVYKCDSGFHLTGDRATGKIGCYGNCDLPWGGEIKHNETVVAYNTGNVACSNDVYVFPRDTKMINQGQPLMTPLYTIVDITKNGIIYEKRAKNGKSYESCGNYDHKKTLICNNGVLELMDKNGKPIQNSSGLAQNYNLISCNLYNYRCNTGETLYNLTQHDIENQKSDKPKNGGSWEVADRGTLQGERGQYEVCIDFDADNPTLNGESCSKKTYHYKFKRCQEHYKQDSDGVCRKQCSLIKNNGYADWYYHGVTVTGYKENLVACPGKCTGVQLTCDDGSWKLDGETVTGYYNYCNNGEVQCDSSYNLTEQKSGGVYSSCTSYEQGTCKETTKYKLDGCADGYHQVPGTTDCAKNRQPMTCETTGKEKPPYSHYTNTTSGAYEKVWSGGKNDYVEEPENPCAWECDSGFVKSADGKRCVLAQCGADTYSCLDGVNATGTGSDGESSWWKCGDVPCCSAGYHPLGSGDTYPYCKENENGMCGPTPENPVHYQCILGDPTGTRDETFIGAGWSWICQGIGSGTSSENCHQCKLHAEWKNERCECEDGYHLEGYECVKNTYTCGEDVEHLYQCKDWNNEWISSTHTGYNAEGDYEWECGDVVCQLEKNVENIYICAEYLEDLPGTSPKNIKFMVVDDNSWPVNVDIELDAQCSVDCSNGEGAIGGVYMYGIESGQKIGSYDRFLLTGYMGCTVNYDTCKDAFFSTLKPHFNVPSGYNVNYLGRCPKTFTYTICENSTESSSVYNGMYQEYTIPSVTHIDFYEKNGNKIPFRVEIKQPILRHLRNEIGIGSDGHYSFGNRNTYTCNSIYYIKTGDINSTSEQKPYCLNQYTVDGITSYMTIGGDPLIVPVALPIGEDEYQFNVEVNCPTPPNYSGCSSYGNNLQPCPQSVVSQTQGATVYGNVGDYQCVKKGCCMKNSAILFGQCKV